MKSGLIYNGGQIERLSLIYLALASGKNSFEKQTLIQDPRNSLTSAQVAIVKL